MKPRQDVMAFHNWFAAGFKERTGANIIEAKQFRLFNRPEVDVVGPQPKPENLPQEQLVEFRRRIQEI